MINLKEGVSKCGLLLVFSIIFGLSLVVCSNTNASSHNFVGVPLATYYRNASGNNCFIIDENTGKYVQNYDWQACHYHQQTFGLHIAFQGDAYSSDVDSYNTQGSMSYITTKPNNEGKCSLYGQGSGNNSLHPLMNILSNGYSFGGNSSGAYFDIIQDNYFNIPSDSTNSCHRRHEFGTSEQPEFAGLGDISGYLTCGRQNGAKCDGIWDTRNYISTQILNWWYTADTLLLQDHYKDNDGFRYSNNFSLYDLFDNPINKFSHLTIPLNDTDEWYFYNPDNLTSGRSFEFSGSFDFKGSFAWHENISSNGSYFRIYYVGYSANTSNEVSSYVDCTTNLISIDGLTRLEYYCPLNLPDDLIYIDLSLQIDGNGNYVWLTDNEWFFNSTTLITDHDNSPGRSFSKSVGGSQSFVPGSAKNTAQSGGTTDIVIDGANYNQTLINLFGFSFLNPFAPLLQMFSDNYSCAQIPTLANMLHSEESTICPWFDSSVRNITTPVLGIASMMLIFGFAVRWLGSSSGNLFEDSANETLAPPSADPHWGRRKK